MKRLSEIHRVTRETDIHLKLSPDVKTDPKIDTGVPFFDHMLHAMAFHGGMDMTLQARGDIQVDFHHLVEDTGLVLGQALADIQSRSPALQRFAWTIIPMDEALSQVVIDVCRRPTLVYQADYPQPLCGSFEMALLEEFFQALSAEARISLHLTCFYGRNSHHMAESLFKALGKSLSCAYTLSEGSEETMSTKGMI